MGWRVPRCFNRINYETRWLSRKQFVDVGFRAVRQLMESKAEVGALPRFCVRDYNARIDDALQFIPVVHEVDCLTDAKERARQLDLLGDDIIRRNNTVLFGGVMNQAFPLNRHIGGRWFDEMGWDQAVLEQAQEPVAAATPWPLRVSLRPSWIFPGHSRSGSCLTRSSVSPRPS